MTETPLSLPQGAPVAVPPTGRSDADNPLGPTRRARGLMAQAWMVGSDLLRLAGRAVRLRTDLSTLARLRLRSAQRQVQRDVVQGLVRLAVAAACALLIVELLLIALVLALPLALRLPLTLGLAAALIVAAVVTALAGLRKLRRCTPRSLVCSLRENLKGEGRWLVQFWRKSGN